MPHNPSLPTPNNPEAKGVTFLGTVEIECPPSLAWKILTDFASYHRWNTFSPIVEFPSSPSTTTSTTPTITTTTDSTLPMPGDEGTLHWRLNLSDSTQTHPIRIISIDEKERKIEWAGIGSPRWLLRPERVQTIEELGEEGRRCRFTSHETMQGPIQGLVGWWMGERLDRANERMGRDLKRWIESGDYLKG